MPGFSVKGSGVASTPAVWFGTLPDKLTLPLQGVYTNVNTTITAFSPANYVNLFTPYNPNTLGGPNAVSCSFGSFTQAPDGTNAAQKMVESATTGFHAANAILPTSGLAFGGYIWRFSVFAKAAERTRFAMMMNQGVFDTSLSQGNGIIIIFDLAGGQVGVAPSTYNSVGGAINYSYVAGSAEIIPYGNGWYRCSFDAVIGGNTNNIAGWTIALDSGSGTGAASTNYAGNGTSGMYFWRATSLPPGAWSMSSQVFFDDFTTLATIDVNNTLAPTFNWYLGQPWPLNVDYASIPSTNTSSFAITGGTHFQFDGTANTGITLLSAGPTGGGSTYVGQGWKPPFYFETKLNMTNFLANNSYFGTCLEFLTNTTAFVSVEHDYMETSPTGPGNLSPNHSELFIPGGPIVGGGVNGIPVQTPINSFNGFPLWNATYSWHTNIVIFSGALYQATGIGGNVNKPPPSNLGTFWNTFTQSGPVILPTSVGYDQSVDHVYACLCIAPSKYDPYGHDMCFLDGCAVASGYSIYGKKVFIGGNTIGSLPFFVGDNQHHPIFYSIESTAVPSSVVMSIDYCKVIQ